MGENRAVKGQWNAWRYPTDEERAAGRRSYDVVWVGADESKDVAARMLRPYGGGQLQHGLDGEVDNI